MWHTVTGVASSRGSQTIAGTKGEASERRPRRPAPLVLDGEPVAVGDALLLALASTVCSTRSRRSSTTLPANGSGDAIRVTVGPKGRVVVPAPIRRELGIEEGTELMARVEGDGIVLEPRSAAIRRLQALVRATVPEGVSLGDELIAERREEARREEAELETGE